MRLRNFPPKEYILHVDVRNAVKFIHFQTRRASKFDEFAQQGRFFASSKHLCNSEEILAVVRVGKPQQQTRN